jgi:hypothetical protein
MANKIYQRKLVATMDRRQFEAALDRLGLDPNRAGPALGSPDGTCIG